MSQVLLPAILFVLFSISAITGKKENLSLSFIYITTKIANTLNKKENNSISWIYNFQPQFFFHFCISSKHAVIVNSVDL